MKKFLLSAFALAVAFSAAAFQMYTPTQKTFTPKALNGKIEKVAKPTMKLMNNGSKISSLSDISGEYVMMYYDYFNDYAPTYSNVTITKVSGDTYKISGWWFSGALDLTATVDQSEGTLTIPRQQIYEYEGDAPADLVNANDDAEENDPLVGTIYMDGIVFDCAWGAMITEGDYEGYFYALGVYAYLLEPNGTMSWSKVDTSTGEVTGTTTVNVYLEQDADTVFIGNFMDYGLSVKAILAEGRTFTIPSQLVYSGGSTYGDFYTSEIISWYDDDEFTDITGTGTETTLTDNLEYGWTVASTTGYWMSWLKDLTITRTDGDVFVWPGEVVVIPDVYILGQVGDNDWAPNVGQQMVYSEETGLYTAEIECKDADNNGYDYFSFTTMLAEDANDWDGIAAARFGAVSNGDFLVTDEWLGQELSLTAPGEAYKVLKGKYNLTLDYANMKLIIEKVAEPFLQGDVNGDGEIDVRDITALIDVIMNSITDNPRADVNQDGDIDVRDITALIDIIMNS